MTDHALKAAREIVLNVIKDPSSFTEERVAERISQAIQEATGPYRELADKWQARAEASTARGKATKPSTYTKCAQELRALLPKETK